MAAKNNVADGRPGEMMVDSVLYSTRELSQLASEIYKEESNPAVRLLQQMRPYVCPLGDVLPQVPIGARLMDVGCGAGLFLLLLAKLKRIDAGFGFDVSKHPIAAAKGAAQRLSLSDQLTFERRSIEAGIPRNEWPVISAVDVLHHVPAELQRQFVRDLCAAVPSGGRLILKDMVATPRWRSISNQAHDLLLARQLVQHADLEVVEGWTRQEGFSTVYRNRVNVLWYGHWTLVLDRNN